MKNLYDFVEVKNILKDIFPHEAKACYFEGFIYSDFSTCSLYFEDKNNENSSLFENINLRETRNILKKIIEDSYDSAKGDWNHYQATLTNNGNFNMNVAYIPEDDRWSHLIMRGISDLTEDESKKLGIPKDLWLERIKHKGTGTSGNPKSEFY